MVANRVIGESGKTYIISKDSDMWYVELLYHATGKSKIVKVCNDEFNARFWACKH